MKTTLRRLQTLFFVLFFSKQLFASHVGGGYITYQYTGNLNEYIITYHTIQSCLSGTSLTGATVCYSSSFAGVSNMLDLLNVSIDTIPYITCGGNIGYCNNGSPILKVSCSGTITLPSPAPDWIFDLQFCCRNAAITNLQNAASFGIYVYATIDNLNAPDNSSPQFNDSVYYEYCTGKLSEINFSCHDVDGDSIVYSLIPAHDASGSCPYNPVVLSYNPPFTASNPLSSYIPSTFNSVSGIFQFVPIQLETGLISVQVNEFRNGNLISTLTREDLITSGVGFQNPDFIKGRIFYDLNSNGIQDVNEYGQSGINVIAQPYGFHAATDSMGDYSLQTYFGNYNVSIANMPKYYHAAPVINSASFAALGQTDSLNDFALIPDSSVVDLALYGNYAHKLRPCDTTSYQLTIHNVGTDTIGSILFASIPSIFSIINSVPAADSVAGNELWWSVPTLYPGQIFNYQINIVVSCSVVAGTQFCDSAFLSTSQSDINPIDDSLFNCGIIVSSFDPNYKEVSEDVISPLFVSNHDWLYYIIHFQNVGTAPALNVNIKDGMDHNLEAGSLEMISYSHPCSYNINSTGLVDFNFFNINLPDSLSNEPASHGFVEYRVKPKSNLWPGDLIHNAANIYFDNNAPVATSTTETKVGSVTSINEITSNHIQVLIYPNPFHDYLKIKLTDNTKAVFELMDMMGRVLIKKELMKMSTLNASSLINGLYFYRIYDANGNLDNGKLIRQ